MKVVSPARLIRKIAVKGIGLQQINAVVLLMTLILPIAAPIPAWAFDLKLPAPFVEQVSERISPPSRSGFAFLTGSREIVERVVTFLSSSIDDSKANNTNAVAKSDVARERAVRPESLVSSKGDDIEKADTATAPAAADAEEASSEEESAPPAPLVEFSDQEVRDSTYEPENNLGAPPNKSEMDSPNTAAALRIRHRAGIANYSFGVPFASLPGRGIDAAIGMTYNSRVWNKTGEGANASYQFNVDKNWLAPGFTVGYGTLKSHFTSKRIWLVTTSQFKTFNEVVPEGITDSDGTRHQFACTAEANIPGTSGSSYGPTKYCSEYGTTDGAFIKLTYHGLRPISNDLQDDLSAYASTYFILTYTDGTKITYSVPGAQFASNEFAREHYPVGIQDNNGNQIDITYKDGKNAIESVRDTLGRMIRFNYDQSDPTKLVAVTVPGLDGSSERQTIRLYYETLSLDFGNRFAGSATGPSGTTTSPQNYRALRYVYFPGTGSGFQYDYHPNFGMITKITKLTGMTVNGGSALNSMGSVNAGYTEAATTEYSYPDDGSQTPLTDVPRYTERTDGWQDVPAWRTAITEYDAPEPATGVDRVSSITVPDTNFKVEYSTIAYNTTDWMNGLPKASTVTRIAGPLSLRTEMAKTAYTWDQTPADANGRRLPILIKAEVTNDAGQTRQTTFEYDSYLNRTKIREYDFTTTGQSPNELRRTEITYVTGSNWTDNNLVRLPLDVKKIVNNVAVSKSAYEYDSYPTGMAATPGVMQHNSDFDPNSGTHACNCRLECPGGPDDTSCIGNQREQVCDSCPNHDSTTDFRGNVTKVTSFSDATIAFAQNDPNASVKTLSYDITGNVVGVAGVSCCSMKTIEYSSQYQYAYPTKETRGGSTQLITKASYNFQTGLPTETRDENDLATVYAYDPMTLRQTRVDYPNGAWSAVEYNDATFPYSVKSTGSLDATRSISSWSFFNGAGRGFRIRSLTTTGYLSSDIEFDNLGRPRKTFNPYTVANLNDSRPSGTKYTEATQIDALGRTLQTKLPDDTTVSTAFNGVADTPANFKRRSSP